jgi:subtilisin family serine protease
MSCCPSTSLRNLRDLLARRNDVAVYPVGALDFDAPPEDFYLYRPAELLVPLGQVERFLAAARRLGIRVWRLDGDAVAADSAPREIAPGGRGEDEVGDDGGNDEIARFAVGASTSLDALLDRLTRAAEGPLVITPNHVLLTAPGSWHLGPADEPRVTDEVFAAPSDEGAWELSVAVIDGGLPESYGNNPLLSVGVIADAEEPWPYQGAYPVMTFPQGHGSFVAGVVRRHAPAVQIASYLAADPDGVTDEWTLAEQIDLALEQGQAVINLSLGAPSRHDLPLLALRRLGSAARSEGGPIVVAAAGNLDSERKFWPAAEPWAIGVAAVDLRGPAPQRAWFSNWGSWVDVCADGVDVLSSFEERPYRPIADPTQLRYFNGFAIWSGTSFSAPRVSAEVARLLHVHPGWSRQDVLNDLAATRPWISGLGTFVG